MIADNLISEVGVKAHARCESDGKVGEEAECKGADTRYSCRSSDKISLDAWYYSLAEFTERSRKNVPIKQVL